MTVLRPPTSFLRRTSNVAGITVDTDITWQAAAGSISVTTPTASIVLPAGWAYNLVVQMRMEDTVADGCSLVLVDSTDTKLTNSWECRPTSTTFGGLNANSTSISAAFIPLLSAPLTIKARITTIGGGGSLTLIAVDTGLSIQGVPAP